MIFRVDYETRMVSVMTQDLYLSEFTPRFNWAVAGRFVVIFDYPDRPVVIGDYDVRRSKALAFEVPASNLGLFNNNRLIVANAQHEFIAGDPVDAAGFSPLPQLPTVRCFAKRRRFTNRRLAWGVPMPTNRLLRWQTWLFWTLVRHWPFGCFYK